MDDLSGALDEILLGDLECPVCGEYMVPPIELCTNGHNICNKCRRIIHFCPTCEAAFSETRNVTLENIVRGQKFPCDNRRNGCHELFSIEHIAQHLAVCEYGDIKCPFHLFGTWQFYFKWIDTNSLKIIIIITTTNLEEEITTQRYSNKWVSGVHGGRGGGADRVQLQKNPETTKTKIKKKHFCRHNNIKRLCNLTEGRNKTQNTNCWEVY
jgi:hypothetical protein